MPGTDRSDEASPGDVAPDQDHDTTIFYRPAPRGTEPVPVTSLLAGAFRYALIIERGPRAGLTYVLGDGTTIAGRTEDVGIFLGDVTVSRHHARFTVDEEGLSVEDLGSTNGTYVNLERLDKARLNAGDEVIIGKFHLVVAVGDA